MGACSSHRLGPRLGAGLVLGLSGVLVAALGAHAIEFTDVTASVGITELNTSWGASWGDYDGDGDPDLWISNHTLQPSLYLNEVDLNGLFTEIAGGLVFDLGDSHGAQWADIDNDGDQDLVELAGSGGQLDPSPNKVFINDGGALTNQAAALGLDVPLGRGRNPLLLDWDLDGRLDVFYTALERDDGLDPAGIFVQAPNGTFNWVDLLPNDTLSKAPVWGQLTDITFDGVMELATYHRLVDPALEGWRIYDLNSAPFEDLVPVTGPPAIASVRDVAIADFDGDLLPDQFMLRSKTDGSDLVEVGPQNLQIRIHPVDGGEGVDVETAGGAFFLVPTNWFWTPSEIFIGANAFNPPGLSFVLDASNPDHQGLAPFDPELDFGLFVGYDTISGAWQIRNIGSTELNTVIATDAVITAVTPIGFTYPADLSLQDRIFMLEPSGFVETTFVAGPGLTPTSCVSVAAGDFDNDMDVDLYLGCTSAIKNAPNILLENDGTGVFAAVPLAGGAEGATQGRADSVTTADYDQDGFLDLMVTNGNGWPPFNFGPHQLFRNEGNGNHWLEIDLEGTASNRDGIGARVLVTAGGVTQLREHSAGMHNRSQNHARLHFGLGENTTAGAITVEWPSGVLQDLTDVAADQVVTVVEPVPEPGALVGQLSAFVMLRMLVSRRLRRRTGRA